MLTVMVRVDGWRQRSPRSRNACSFPRSSSFTGNVTPALGSVMGFVSRSSVRGVPSLGAPGRGCAFARTHSNVILLGVSRHYLRSPWWEHALVLIFSMTDDRPAVGICGYYAKYLWCGHLPNKIPHPLLCQSV